MRGLIEGQEAFLGSLERHLLFSEQVEELEGTESSAELIRLSVRCWARAKRDRLREIRRTKSL